MLRKYLTPTSVQWVHRNKRIKRFVQVAVQGAAQEFESAFLICRHFEIKELSDLGKKQYNSR
jgi:hypothetical protein